MYYSLICEMPQADTENKKQTKTPDIIQYEALENWNLVFVPVKVNVGKL